VAEPRAGSVPAGLERFHRLKTSGCIRPDLVAAAAVEEPAQAVSAASQKRLWRHSKPALAARLREAQGLPAFRRSRTAW
jgi:hypothetical protein